MVDGAFAAAVREPTLRVLGRRTAAVVAYRDRVCWDRALAAWCFRLANILL
jgi:hypothetical protein